MSKLRMPYVTIEGINFPKRFGPQRLQDALNYTPRHGDFFICTYPRCGSVYMQILCLHLLQKGQDLANIDDIDASFPVIELVDKRNYANRPAPRFFKTHLPYEHIPRSPDAKYIFVARNPVEACEGYYNYVTNLPILGFQCEFEDFFEFFINGDVFFNDYFDHLLGWYPHRFESNHFFATCDNLRQNTANEVMRLAAFLGKEYIEAIENDNAVMRNVMANTSWDRVLKTTTERREWCIKQHFKQRSSEVESVAIPSEAKHLLSSKQKERLKNKFLDKMKGTEILDWFTWD